MHSHKNVFRTACKCMWHYDYDPIQTRVICGIDQGWGAGDQKNLCPTVTCAYAWIKSEKKVSTVNVNLHCRI